MSDLVDRARSWIESDPDPVTREEMTSLIEAEDFDELSSRLDSSLSFGTAGLRGEVGAGPNRMNRAVVIRTTSGLATYLLEGGHVVEKPVVVGFDARPTSRGFAEDVAGVLAAAGIEVRFFADFAPTPLVAYAVKHLGAAAGVVVTASHNPPADNGYKVYSGIGAQIIPPMDLEIASAIDAAPPANEVPLVAKSFNTATSLVSPIEPTIVDSYWIEIDAARPEPSPSSMSIVYTPIHGVGGEVVADVFRRAGFSAVTPVVEQAQPDGRFPTVSFPNPEEAGALDLAMQTANSIEAELVLANDPDADRLAAVARHDNEWRALTGNEIGVLLGDYVLRNWKFDSVPIVVSSIVSSPMLRSIAADHGARHESTLTGFKWIVNAGLSLEGRGEGSFAFGYEEALGYTIGSVVRDKDGISAALVFADLVSGLAQQNHSPVDRLVELWSSVGVWSSAQHSVVRSGPSGPGEIARAVAGVADAPPQSIAGIAVSQVVDYRVGEQDRPSWLGKQSLIELHLGERGRVLVRPSGTEPKLKIYVDLNGKPGLDPIGAQETLTNDAQLVARSLAETLRF